MVDRNAAFRQHFLKVAIADRIATIPAHRPQDHITLEMAPLEIRHRSVRPISAKHAQASRFLQQSLAGLVAARARGRKGGRKPVMSKADTRKAAAMLSDPNITKTEVAKHFSVSRVTLNAALAREGYAATGSARPTPES
jgi:hypothetical protein